MGSEHSAPSLSRHPASSSLHVHQPRSSVESFVRKLYSSHLTKLLAIGSGTQSLILLPFLEVKLMIDSPNHLLTSLIGSPGNLSFLGVTP